MTQLIITLSIGVVYSVASFLYVKNRYKDKKNISISLLISMLIILSGINILHSKYGSSTWIEALEYLTMVAMCMPAAWIDFKEQLIPNPIVFTGFAIRMILYVIRIFISVDGLLNTFKSDGIAFLIIVVFCLAGRLIVKNGIGMGDVKILLVLALLGGTDRLLSLLFFAMIVTFFWGLFELIVRKKGKNATLPFGPSIALGTLVSVVMYAFI